MPHDAITRLARRISTLERQVRHRNAPQLAHSSIEDGALREFTADGQLAAQFGKQWDGTHGAVALHGPTPPQPTTPNLTAVPNGMVISWDGNFTDGSFSPMDLLGVDVVVSGTVGFNPLTQRPVGTFASAKGGSVTIAVTGGQRVWVAFIARSTAGKLSAPSAVISEVALEIEVPSGGTDGIAPGTAGTPTIVPGIGVMYARWPSIALNASGGVQDSVVEFEVHMGNAPGFAKSSATLVATTAATAATLKVDPGGIPLRATNDDGTPRSYWVAVRGRDADGYGAYGPETEGRVVMVTAADIATHSITADQIAAGSITGAQMAAELFIGSRFTTGAVGEDGTITGRRIDLSPLGFYSYDPDGTPRVEMPTDPTQPNVFRGNAEIDHLTVKAGVSFESAENEVAEGSSLTLASGITAPQNPPSVIPVYDNTILSRTDAGTYPGLDPVGGGVWQNFTAAEFATMRGLQYIEHPNSWEGNPETGKVNTGYYYTARLVPDAGAQKVVIDRWAASSGLWNRQQLSFGQGSSDLGGLAVRKHSNGLFIYFITKVAETGKWRFWWYNTDPTVANTLDVKYGYWDFGAALANSSKRPAIGYSADLNEIMVAYVSNTDELIRVNHYAVGPSLHAMTGPPVVAPTNGRAAFVGGGLARYDLAGVELSAGATADFGLNTRRYVIPHVGPKDSGPSMMEVWQDFGSYHAGDSWERGSGDVVGVTWHSAQGEWHTLNTAGGIRHYQANNRFTGTWYMAYTWHNKTSNAQTTRSPVGTWKFMPRSKLQVTTAVLPGSGAADAVRLYLDNVNPGTAKGAMHFQATVTPSGPLVAPQFVIAVPNLAGGADPAGNTFLAGTAALVDTTSGGWWVDGTGNGSVGTAGFRESVRAAARDDRRRGSAVYTTDATGDLTITHDLGVVPTAILFSPHTFGFFRLLTASKAATSFKIRCSDTAGVARGAGTNITIDWEVIA